MTTSASGVSRLIWTFWHSGEEAAPPLVQRCLARFRSLNEPLDWQVVCVDDDSALEMAGRTPPRGFKRLIHPHRADWLRLAVLLRYGGVWLDSSIVLCTPVTEWLLSPDQAAGVDLQAFAVPGTSDPAASPYALLENWAMACAPGNAFVAEWLAECEVAITEGFEAYSRRVEGEIHPILRGRLPYQTTFACWCVARARRLATGRPAVFHLRPSELDRGPFAIHHACEWQVPCVSQVVCRSRVHKHCRWMCKLRGAERSFINEEIAGGAYSDDSTLVVDLGLPPLGGSAEAGGGRWRRTSAALLWLVVLGVVMGAAVWYARRRAAATDGRSPRT